MFIKKRKEMGDTEGLSYPGGPRRVLLGFSRGAAGSGDTCHEKVPSGQARRQASKVFTCNKGEKLQLSIYLLNFLMVSPYKI